MVFKRIAAVLLWLLVTLTSAFGFTAPELKTAPDEFFSGTLEDAQQNGPSAREQCRINGWLNYDTASGYTIAAKTFAEVYLAARFYAPVSVACRWAALDPESVLTPSEVHAFTGISIMSDTKAQSLLMRTLFKVPGGQLGAIGASALGVAVGAAAGEDPRTFLPFLIGTYFEYRIAYEFALKISGHLQAICPGLAGPKDGLSKVFSYLSTFDGIIYKCYEEIAKERRR